MKSYKLSQLLDVPYRQGMTKAQALRAFTRTKHLPEVKKAQKEIENISDCYISGDKSDIYEPLFDVITRRIKDRILRDSYVDSVIGIGQIKDTATDEDVKAFANNNIGVVDFFVCEEVSK